jgi:penicillin-binding protein 1A
MKSRAAKADAYRRRSVPRQPPSLKKKIKTLFALLALAVFVPTAIGAIYFLLIFVQESRNLPSLAEIGSIKPAEGTQIFYADGSRMALFTTENRKPIKLEEMGDNVVKATIATEDSRFYEHSGVDLHGVARAIFKNVTGGEVREGASTITQQLARNINELGIGRERKLRRKVAEAILAMRIEQTFKKEEILEQYLNLIYYGNGAYGVEAAARTYFHKPAKKLSLSQAALLAGLPQRPSRYSDNREAAYKRRDWVLQRMFDTGKITRAQRDEARGQELKIYQPESTGAIIDGAPYFVNYVMQQLVAEYGADAVYSGWKIYTTLDKKMQTTAESEMRKGIKRPDVAANVGALVSLDPHTGYIRAMVGGLDFEKNKFNAVTQGIRQPGSAFKPIVYCAAFDTDTANLDSTYTDDPFLPGIHDKKWRVKNYKGTYTHGPMRVRSAIRYSINTVAVKTALDTGLDRVIEYARRLGITTPIDKYATLALGASGVRPIELCTAYTAFANPDGRRVQPMSIVKVIDNKDELILQNSPHLVQTNLRPETVEQMNEALREVVEQGTGNAVIDVPNAHGKTGTTSDNRDAWFAGYTPELVTVIWAAHENRGKNGKLSRSNPYPSMDGETGGHLCAPIWRDYMMKAVPLQIAFNKTMQDRRAAQTALDMTVPPKPATPPKKEPAAEAAAAAAAKEKAEAAKQQTTTAPTPIEQGTGAPMPATDPSASGPSTTLPDPPGPGPATGPSIQPSTPIQPATNRGDGGSRVSEPGARLAAPVVDPNDEMVSVKICAESGKRATQWCSVTTDQRMRKRDKPGFCRRHRDPDGIR